MTIADELRQMTWKTASQNFAASLGFIIPWIAAAVLLAKAFLTRDLAEATSSDRDRLLLENGMTNAGIVLAASVAWAIHLATLLVVRRSRRVASLLRVSASSAAAGAIAGFLVGLFGELLSSRMPASWSLTDYFGWVVFVATTVGATILALRLLLPSQIPATIV